MFPYIPNTTISLYAIMIGLGAAIGILVSVLRIPSASKYTTNHLTNYSVSKFNEVTFGLTADNLPKFNLQTTAPTSYNLTRLHLLFCALYAFAFGLVGAKLFYIIGNIGNVISGEMTVFQLFSSGFMFYGGFFGGAFGIFLYCKLFKIKMIKVLDALSLGLALGQCFGRIGCFCAGCCYGVPTNSPIGVVFTNPADISIPLGISLVPVQLIESALCFSIFIFLMIYGSKKNENGTFFRKDGALFSLYCILYAVGRFIIEFWRGDAERGFVGLLSWSQFISIIILIVVSLIYIVLYVRKRRIIKADMRKEFLTN